MLQQNNNKKKSCIIISTTCIIISTTRKVRMIDKTNICSCVCLTVGLEGVNIECG